MCRSDTCRTTVVFLFRNLGPFLYTFINISFSWPDWQYCDGHTAKDISFHSCIHNLIFRDSYHNQGYICSLCVIIWSSGTLIAFVFYKGAVLFSDTKDHAKWTKTDTVCLSFHMLMGVSTDYFLIITHFIQVFKKSVCIESTCFPSFPMFMFTICSYHL